MNIVEALNIAKEQRKKVRPIGVNWCVTYEDDFVPGFFARNNILTKKWNRGVEYLASPKEILKDWEVVEDKKSKQTQYKIDSIKFQIVRYCNNTECYNCERELRRKCTDKIQVDSGYYPAANTLDDWSLKEIVEAYHILKEAGEI